MLADRFKTVIYLVIYYNIFCLNIPNILIRVQIAAIHVYLDIC